ncbi:hypothetical protein H8356DRAFT_940899 [Neocallimastix lanati (nom. inval.)]|uniref:RING-CH-type domain-containing protein n=1 Tax=Neocallimastix californiae TaxID=1754190 RepID=A0A1Y2AD15_9FUNG|nr:hypothetical protein H8356DRAFT_940899 [Neocallimastix sp. JGI-2020a]ORY20180.1 hypothetical protein LY90DRAFT_707980 [Neocallimastix californiae]|eukprot:ORY20180.1 hypothetical protein LY90DRAFT_707980 [Neocallimastix californiae]
MKTNEKDKNETDNNNNDNNNNNYDDDDDCDPNIKLWERLKKVDSNIIKKSIYDYYYEGNKDDLLCHIESFYNSLIRLFIYSSLFPKWIYWMIKNLFFVDLWKNPFLFYNKSCFKYNEEVDETYLSQMSYSKRKNILNGSNDAKNIYAEKSENNQCNELNNEEEYQKSSIFTENNNNNDNSINDSIRIEEMSNGNTNNNNNNIKIDNNNYNKSNDNIPSNNERNLYKKNDKLYHRGYILRNSNSLSCLNIPVQAIKKSDSIDIPLRKTNSSSFFKSINDKNESSLGIEKERNILRTSYISLDEFFRNIDGNDDGEEMEDSYHKLFHDQKQKIKHSFYNKYSNFEKKIMNQPLSYKIYDKFIYPITTKLASIQKSLYYKKNKFNFICNVQKNVQKMWWMNQRKIKQYQKKYILLNRIPEDVSYYIDKLISPCQCKGSQKYVHSYCLDEWRLKTTIEYGHEERCLLCRQKYRKKDNNKWYTKLQNKEIQNTILYLTIIVLIILGGYLMKYILNITYKYLDIGFEYEIIQDRNNTSLWNINNYEEYNTNQETYIFQTQDNTMNMYSENIIYSIPDEDDNNAHIKIHNFLFSEFFLTSIGLINSTNYHIMAGMFLWGSIINTWILYDSIKMVIRHHFNSDVRFKPLLLLTIIYFWWIYCSAAFEDLIGVNEYSISQTIETIIFMKAGWATELIGSILFGAKWTLRIVTMELGIYFNGVCYLKELLTFNYSACLNKDQILNYETENDIQ